jgi:hypothetical protein
MLPIIVFLIIKTSPVGVSLTGELATGGVGSGQDCPAGAMGIVTKLLTIFPIRTVTGT